MGVRHTTQIAGANNAGSDVSANAWNNDHAITDFAWSVIVATPALEQADWSPTGWNDAQPNRAVVIRAQPASVSYLSGLAGGVDGRIAVIKNDTVDGLICLCNEDAASAAVNRLSLRREGFWLLPEQQARFAYDGNEQRWELASFSMDARALDIDAAIILPNTTTSVQSFGIQTSNTATLSTIAPTATPTNEFTARPATQITNGTANGSSDVRGNALNYMRGATTRRQGFWFEGLMRITAASATGGAMVGMVSSTAALTGLPSAVNNNIYCGIGQAGQTTLRVGARDGSAFTEVDLGANYPVPNATAAYAVVLMAVPTQARVTYAVRRLDAAFRTGGALTANLPATTVGLTPRANINVGATAAATTLQFGRLFARHLNY